MSKKIDLTGQKFGHWTVLEYDKDGKWLCHCDCGTERTVAGPSLRRGISTSCGCAKVIKAREENGKFINEIGNRYGRLTVIAKDEQLSIEKHRAQWICLCDCGNLKTVSSKCLRAGKTTSCGCLLSKGEEKINRLLQEMNIHFTTQYIIPTGERYSHYRYDFALLDENNHPKCFIEYNGSQHYEYKTTNVAWNNAENFELTQQRDAAKKELAAQYNIPLYIIPYWEYNNIEERIKEIITEINS